MNHRTVTRVINGMQTSDGAGVSLVRYIGSPDLDMLDPFLLLDQFKSDDPDDYIAGFPPHPHRGFETVTYLHAGRVRHKDSAGNEGVIEPGGVQWMTAGRGVIHSEMPEQAQGLLSGFQLWVNLPTSHKMQPATYQEFPPEDVPLEIRDGARVIVVTGTTSRGTRGSVHQPLTNPQYLDVSLEPGSVFSEPVPEVNNAFILVTHGKLDIPKELGQGRDVLEAGQLGILSGGNAVEVFAGSEGTRFLLISGQPIGEPVARGGPFVMNHPSEIRQAFQDYQRGHLIE